MSKRMLMAEQWDHFARAVLAEGTSPIQRREMRRAFYAGAQGMFHGVIVALTLGHGPTDADVDLLQGVVSELNDFAELVKAGRA